MCGETIGYVLVDMGIDEIERCVMMTMLTGGLFPIDVLEKQFALLRELADFAESIPDVDFEILKTPYSWFVRPKNLPVRDVKRYKYHYDFDTVASDWVKF